MSWRGQGGRRAKGRRSDQDPELDNTAWLAELEQQAAQADDDEEDWASTLRGRRAGAPPPPPAPPAADPGWAPTPDPAPPPPDYRHLGMEPEGPGSSSWDVDPVPEVPDPDWSAWRQPEPPPDPEPQGWRPAGGDAETAAWAPTEPAQPEPPARPWAPAEPAQSEPPSTAAWEASEPVGREPDYPALFGELYRRSAAHQDPWEVPPAEPLPDHSQTDPPASAWPFEETTQSWEPSDRSFVWPSHELPSTPTEWEPASSSPWLDDPAPPAPSAQHPAPAPPVPEPDQTAAWPAPAPPPAPWPAAPGVPPVPPSQDPPPADWAAAIPTDVPAARRVADPSAVTRAWRPDESLEAEPAVPLGGHAYAPPGQATEAPEAEDDWRAAAAAERRRRLRLRQAEERPPRAWPRIVAVISWIVLLMVVCWFYVFPWLERVLPENF